MTILSATVAAESLGFPEGPLVLGASCVAFVELYRASINVFEEGVVRTLAVVGGGLDFVAPRCGVERAVHRQIWAEDVMATNCAFEGSTLWVTDASSASDEVERPSGRLWRLETNLAGKELF